MPPSKLRPGRSQTPLQPDLDGRLTPSFCWDTESPGFNPHQFSGSVEKKSHCGLW